MSPTWQEHYQTECPRCEGRKTNCLGNSMCRYDKHPVRIVEFELEEWKCEECGMFWKQYPVKKEQEQ